MKPAKITFLSSIGAGLEYYDYVIYVIFASFISQNFFPETNRVAALFATFSVFAIGNVISPLGGIILGMYGDRLGRKKVFTTTMLLMALATFLMGITPTFATIGLAATIIFSLCRVLQGIACGAEIPGATTFLSEHIHQKRHGLHIGFMGSTVGLGTNFGLLIAWILTKLLTGEQMLSWGFRIPFLLGSTLGIIGFLIRRYIPETPAFLAQKPSNRPLIKLDKENYKQIIRAIGMIIFPACLVNLFLAFPVFLHDFYHYPYPDIYLAMMIGSLWTSFLIPIFGWISDRFIERKKLLVITILIFVTFSFPVFSLLHLKTRLALFVFILFGKTLIAAMAASYFVLLPQAFATTNRYTGTAFSYSIAYTLAGFIPLVINYFYGVLNSSNYLIWTLIILATLAIISILALQIKHDLGTSK